MQDRVTSNQKLQFTPFKFVRFTAFLRMILRGTSCLEMPGVELRVIAFALTRKTLSTKWVFGGRLVGLHPTSLPPNFLFFGGNC
jgi:hypothetical protein